MSRSAAREDLFKLVYEYVIIRERNELTLSLLTNGKSESDAEYIKSCYEGIIQNLHEIEDRIARLSQGFKLDRVYKVDLAILIVAIYEICYRDDIPPSVSAAEGTELAKKYSTDKSYSFVNGILASVIRGEDK